MLLFLLIYFRTRLLPDLSIHFFQAEGRRRRRPNLAVVFWFTLCCSIFCYGYMRDFVVFVSVFGTKPLDWLGRTSPIWPVFVSGGTWNLNPICYI